MKEETEMPCECPSCGEGFEHKVKCGEWNKSPDWIRGKSENYKLTCSNCCEPIIFRVEYDIEIVYL